MMEARIMPGDRAGNEVLPSLTVAMPCRNEHRHIEESVASVLAFDYPHDRLRLIVVDGMSDDGTRALLDRIAGQEPRLSVLDNPGLLPAPALNAAMAVASGEVFLRVDAHTLYPPDYARRCVLALFESGADNVGGVCDTIPGAPTAMARAIAFAMGNRFGVGNADFRTGVTDRRWTDTVPFGCWRLDTLRRLGGFATDLPYAEDDDLNARLRRGGGRILLDPGIRSRYIARSTLGRLALMMYRYGRWKPVSSARIGGPTSWRQLVPPAFVATLATSAVLAAVWPWAGLVGLAALAAHLFAASTVALKAAGRLGPGAALRLPAVFLTMHASYGAGYVAGLFALVFRGRGPAQTAP